MLSDSNIRKINDQIKKELDTVDSWVSDADDKAAALKRITKLNALLNPQPSREEILKELADAIVNADRTRNPHAQPTSASDLVSELVTMFRR